MVSLLCCCCSITTATALLLLLLLCTILHSSLLLALLCSYYYLTSTTLLSYIYYSATSLSHSFSGSTELLFSGYSSMLRAALRGQFETAEGLSIGQGRFLLCLLSPSLLLSSACCACSLHLWCCWCCLVLALSRAAGANTRGGVFVLLRSGFWWDDRDNAQI